MKLSEADAKQFFELMTPLQLFVNQKLKLKPEVKTLAALEKLGSENRLPIRDAVYQHPELIDEFIKQNPQKFTPEQLGILKGWKNPIVGDFFIERLLKKYAVFIHDGEVYGVFALHDAFDEIFDPAALPVYVKAVLLPYQGKIVYDGILQGYNVFFGGGIKGNLKEDYLTAKQNGRIIETLEPVKAKRLPGPTLVSKDQLAELEKLAEQINKLRSSRDAPPLRGPTIRLLKASIELARYAADRPEDLEALWKRLDKAMNAAGQVENTLIRAER